MGTANRAVVLGGSIAGVLAARVLAETFAEVVVVDRDRVRGTWTSRPGSPHTRHAHGLHARGLLVIDELFPGLLDELRAGGAPIGDLGRMRWFFQARELVGADTGLLSVTAPRPEIEERLRRRVDALREVRFLEEHEVTGLVVPDGRTVAGVRLRPRGATADHVLDASLVVDATGRNSRLPAWLEGLGYAPPPTDKVRIDLAYTTRRYRLSGGVLEDTQSINPVACPAHPRGAFFGRTGPDLAVLSLTGILGDRPPKDPEGFDEFVRSLPVPDIYEALGHVEPVDEAVTFGFPASTRRRYERLADFPRGLVLVGDALCSFNPVYGQGMSVAASEARLLREHLRRPGPLDPAAYLADAARLVDAPWMTSTSGDLDFPGVVGPRPASVRVGNAYMARLQFAATRDPRLARSLMRVAGLVEPPTSLMRPAAVGRVLRHALRAPGPGPARPAAARSTAALPELTARGAA